MKNFIFCTALGATLVVACMYGYYEGYKEGYKDGYMQCIICKNAKEMIVQMKKIVKE